MVGELGFVWASTRSIQAVDIFAGRLATVLNVYVWYVKLRLGNDTPFLGMALLSPSCGFLHRGVGSKVEQRRSES